MRPPLLVRMVASHPRSLPAAAAAAAGTLCCAPLPPPPQVVKQCVGTEGVEPDYIKTEILPDFFTAFWNRRMALDRRNYKALVETTVALANKVGGCRGGAGGVGGWVGGRHCACSTHLRKDGPPFLPCARSRTACLVHFFWVSR